MPTRTRPSLPPGRSRLPQPISTPPARQRTSCASRHAACCASVPRSSRRRSRRAAARAQQHGCARRRSPPCRAPARRARRCRPSRRRAASMTTKVMPITVVAACGDQTCAAIASCQRAPSSGRVGDPRPADGARARRRRRASATHAGAAAPASLRQRARLGTPNSGATRQAAEVEADRRDDVGPFARAEARDRAEDAGAVDIGAEAEQRRRRPRSRR